MIIAKLASLALLSACLGCQTNGNSTIKNDSKAVERYIGPQVDEKNAKPAEFCMVSLAELSQEEQQKLTLFKNDLVAIKLIESFPFVAFDPEKSYFVYIKGEKKLVAHYASTVKAVENAPSLVQFIDNLCNKKNTATK